VATSGTFGRVLADFGQVRAVLLLAVVLLAAAAAHVATASDEAALACARGYFPCLPVRGDLDCGQIPDAKRPVRVVGEDQYALDADNDGIGCETGNEGGGLQSRYGLVLRKRGKEVVSTQVGQTLTAVGWSPTSAKGTRYRLCSRSRCVTATGYVLKGTAPQTFGTWRVARNDGDPLKVSLRVGVRNRASDTAVIFP
jgi:hypothetical protein